MWLRLLPMKLRVAEQIKEFHYFRMGWTQVLPVVTVSKFSCEEHLIEKLLRETHSHP